MAICKILKSYDNAEGWEVGDIVDISNPDKLIVEGKVELYVKPEKPKNNGMDAKREASGSKASAKGVKKANI